MPLKFMLERSAASGWHPLALSKLNAALIQLLPLWCLSRCANSASKQSPHSSLPSVSHAYSKNKAHALYDRLTIVSDGWRGRRKAHMSILHHNCYDALAAHLSRHLCAPPGSRVRMCGHLSCCRLLSVLCALIHCKTCRQCPTSRQRCCAYRPLDNADDRRAPHLHRCYMLFVPVLLKDYS